MDTSTPFTWRHFQAEIILLCVRWYLRYPLSSLDLEEMLRERGFQLFNRRLCMQNETVETPDGKVESVGEETDRIVAYRRMYA